MAKKVLRPKNLEFQPRPTFPYSPGARGGNMVFTAGQVAWDKTGNLIGINDVRAQTVQTLANVEAVLKEGGAADFVLFRGRQYSELFSRSQHDRLVIRNGQWIAATVPHYDELDPILNQHALTKTQPLVENNNDKENRKTTV